MSLQLACAESLGLAAGPCSLQGTLVSGWELCCVSTASDTFSASFSLNSKVCLSVRLGPRPRFAYPGTNRPAAWRVPFRARLPSWAIFHSTPQSGGGSRPTPPGRRRDRKAHSATPKANKVRLSVRRWAADSGMSGCPRTSSTSSFALITFCQTRCPRRAQAPAAAAHQCYRDRTPQRSSRYVAR